MLKVFKSAAVAAFVVLTAQGAQAAPLQAYYGDVAAQPNGYLLTSDPTGLDYAGLYFQYTSPITLGSITQLSADFQMTQGTIGNGAPRRALTSLITSLRFQPGSRRLLSTPAGSRSCRAA